MAETQKAYLHGTIEFYQARTNTKMTIAAERLAVIAQSRYRDGRFAELEFVRRRDPRQSDDRELPPQDVRRGGGISWWAVSSAISRHPG
jgi:hypothetical protein